MDPRECMQRVIDAYNTTGIADRDLYDAARDYNGWTDRGGFQARVVLDVHQGAQTVNVRRVERQCGFWCIVVDNGVPFRLAHVVALTKDGE